MPDWTLVDRSHVQAALKEHDRLGQREFLSRYRFGRSKAHTLWHGGQEYDAKAIFGVAYVYATGRAATQQELRSGEADAARVLKGLGFDVVVDELALEAEERRARSTPAPARAATAASEAGQPAPKTPARKQAAPKTPTPVKPVKAKPVERPVVLCPTCYTAVPATGVCDFCD